MDSGQRTIENTDLEAESSGLAGPLPLGDAVDVAEWSNTRQPAHAPQHVDQQLDHRVTHRLFAGALAQSPVRQLVVNNVQAMGSGRVQHHSCSAGTFTDAVLLCARLSVEHNRAITLGLVTC